ncbi:MAG: preprotein translocase subunit SecA [Candidatus Abyssobacteria bacterium SURF_17]|uniref:Protein translocase subunit SecA n=1 Tax=Candidatus Abyssobacteria bacterium SURF_17 TaxID=2093361 RepID=A0A419EQD0_9BACT|nr:MAG: preprotein translocase subunit SecA [Candidatus Abyssubacteria bacterium SURF_17]
MIFSLLGKLFGTKHERDIKKLLPLVDEIKSHEAEMAGLSDRELRAKTAEFKRRLSGGETLDDILPEAYAVVKEGCRRLYGKTWFVRGHEITWDMVHFDCQLIGGIVLHQGKIAEMATGEGKTLVATLPIYLNALTGKGVHLITVNDYLASRDREWMGPIYEFLGLAAGCIQQRMDSEERQSHYRADVTCGTNSEFGFDYLRDNMCVMKEQQVQRGHHYAIVDEVDSVLIDEARTPLIISGPVEQSNEQYEALAPAVDRLYKQQQRIVGKLLEEAEKLVERGETYEAGKKLLMVKKGAPKDKRFLELMENPKLQKLVHRVELDMMGDKLMAGTEESALMKLVSDLYFTIDEKQNVADLTEKGRRTISSGKLDMFVVLEIEDEERQINVEIEELLADDSLDEQAKLAREAELEAKRWELYDRFNAASQRIHAVSQLLKANSLFERDVDYIVTDNKVVIVDEFTGRLMPSRRYSDGLHQALEAKERVKVGEANQTLATITLQNYYKMHDKLAGMTGTADTEAQEFHDIYKLDVVVIPTNRQLIRYNYPDVIHKTEREKFRAVINEIKEMHKLGRPVLVGTISVEKSETLGKMLRAERIPHHILNAKYHEREAEIVARAGQRGAVTIATNMAGRGTDIKLGESVAELGGLHIVGTERHESRRIDNQLRGRSGRQGDPGSSRFYISLEDDLMRLFGSDRIMRIMERLGIEEDQPIEHGLVTKSIETAQKRVEAHNLEIRKHLLKYDDVMNTQREIIYAERQKALDKPNIKEHVLEMLDDVLEGMMEEFVPADTLPDEWNLRGLSDRMRRRLGLHVRFEGIDLETVQPEEIFETLQKIGRAAYEDREKRFGSETMREIERVAILRAVDSRWKDHLYAMDLLKEGIGLRGYGGKDPLVEYKHEAYNLFSEMIADVKLGVAEFLFRVQVAKPEKLEEPVPVPSQTVLTAHDSSVSSLAKKAPQQTTVASDGAKQPAKVPVRVGQKVGRNEPCPCGSGKKYKKCCGVSQ